MDVQLPDLLRLGNQPKQAGRATLSGGELIFHCFFELSTT
jgi:hypothetical protein